MAHFKNIYGQDLAIKILKSAISKEHISSAYLFSGPEGVGRRKTAKVFIKAILDEKSMLKEDFNMMTSLHYAINLNQKISSTTLIEYFKNRNREDVLQKEEGKWVFAGAQKNYVMCQRVR